jgi:hypothetical protein
MNALGRRKRHIAAAGGLDPRQSQICLPADLTDEVPSCSFACILSFSQQNITPNDCHSTSSLEFLCRSHSLNGLTIGEASLQCVVSECPSQITNALLLQAYNICDGVDNALPNTASVINVTVRNTSTAPPPATTAPAAPTAPVAAPTELTTPAAAPTSSVAFTPVTSMTVSDASLSVTVQMMMPTTATTQTPGPARTDAGSNLAPDDMPSMNTGLSSGAIAGTAAGASLAGVLFLALLFLCLRRRRQTKEDKAAWPKQISSPDTATSQASTFGLSESTKPLESNRRSFWRLSIKPNEIGMAVSDRPGARRSALSTKEMPDNILGRVGAKYTSPRSSWPAPPQTARAVPARPPRESLATVFDEDIEHQPNQPPGLSAGGAYFTIAQPSQARQQRLIPEPLQLDRTRVISPSTEAFASPVNSATLPLTPRYDNGNFVVTPPRPFAPNSIAAALASTVPISTQGQVPVASPNTPASNTSPRRNRLQKPASYKRPNASAPPARQDSESTFFDTDTSPEEVDKSLEATSYTLDAIPQSPRSPAGNVRYPAVPDTAALSPQARQMAQSRYLFESTHLKDIPKGIRPRRDTFLQNRPNYLNTDSGSSGGGISDYSIDWPVPPSGRPTMTQAPPLASLARLGSRMTVASNYSQRPASEYSLPPEMPARLAPAKTNNTGDLFFKVEMH